MASITDVPSGAADTGPTDGEAELRAGEPTVALQSVSSCWIILIKRLTGTPGSLLIIIFYHTYTFAGFLATFAPGFAELSRRAISV